MAVLIPGKDVESTTKRINKKFLLFVTVLLLAASIVAFFKVKKAIYLRNNDAEALASLFLSNRESFEKAATTIVAFDGDYIEIIRAEADSSLEERNGTLVEKKMDSLKILTSEKLTDEQYNAIHAVFLELFQSVRIVSCYNQVYYHNDGKKYLTRVCFLISQYKEGATQWYSCLYYDSEQNPDVGKQLIQITALGEQELQIDSHWCASLERIN